MSALTADALDERIDSALDFIHRRQGEDGELPMLRSFLRDVPDLVQPSEFPGWYTFGKCPFAAANIVIALHEVEDPRAREIRQRAVAHLQRGLEHGVARYMAGVSFPADIDDTALVHVALEWNGISAGDCRAMIAANRTAEHDFYTWFIPRPRQALHPLQFAWLVRDALRWRAKIKGEGWLNHVRLSSEPAVAANVLLYLDDDSPAVERLIGRMGRGDVPLQYYDDLLFAHFHVARTAYYRVPRLAVLSDVITRYIAGRAFEDSFRAAAAAITLCYLGHGRDELTARIVQSLLQSTEAWRPIHYCNGLDGSFRDGSAELTAAMHLEAFHRVRTALFGPQKSV